MAQQDTPTKPKGLQVLETRRRVGMFTVRDALLRESIGSGLAARLFYGAVPLDVQRNWFHQTNTYLLWHPSFDEIPEGGVIPDYLANVENGVITWERCGPNANTPEPFGAEKMQQMLQARAA